MKTPILECIIVCPECAAATPETMPTHCCVVVYECPACHTTLRPRDQDCCVFCSYGSTPCPPIQTNGHCCD